MTYSYAVKVNGNVYPAGTEVPEVKAKETKEEAKKTDKAVKGDK